MRRDLRSSANSGPVSAWGQYKSDDDHTNSDDFRCRWRLSRLELRSSRPKATPPHPARCTRRIRPATIVALRAYRIIDSVDDQDAPDAQSSTALPPPGPVLSPDDPRYGRPAGAAPVYSGRAAPTGPILSPDDPRYGRPDGAPPVYSDRAAPTGPILSPDDPRYGRPDGPPPVIYSDRGTADPRAPADDGLRPPEAVGAPGAVTGSVEPAAGPDGKPMTIVRAAAGRTAGDRLSPARAKPAPAGSAVRHQGAGGNVGRRYPEHLSLLRAG